MYKIINWFIEKRTKDDFTAPELAVSVLMGNVYGHPNFPNGTFIHTSPIVGIHDMGDHKTVVTQSGSIYSLYPEVVHPDAEKSFPGYYNRLSMKEEK